MLGSHAAEIVEDFLELSEDWPQVEAEAEPELDLPPLPPPRPPWAVQRIPCTFSITNAGGARRSTDSRKRR